jgi:hypothetical protein
MAAADVASIIASYRGELPGGFEGDRLMCERLTTEVLQTSDGEDVQRNRLTTAEIDDLLAYLGWQTWDMLAARTTEGESGLIPRQEYESIGFVQSWADYPRFIEEITREVGVDGIVELGRTPHREIGSKLNQLHHWALPFVALAGRGIAIKLGQSTAWERLAEVNALAQWMRRLQHGVWGGGRYFASAHGYRQLHLDAEWLERFQDEKTDFRDEEGLRSAVRQFNASTELHTFMLHMDNRLGLGDTGPYPLPGGGVVLVRDHFLNEPALQWNDLCEGLPHAVTMALFFESGEDVEIRINDIGTTFTTPRDYLQHLTGAVVYAREKWDTPISEIRKLDREEIDAISARATTATLALYRRVAAMSRRERIMAGVGVYHRDIILPYARAAGLWDRFLHDLELDEIAPMTNQAYYALAGGGQAMEILAGLFMLGEGFLPFGERATW